MPIRPYLTKHGLLFLLAAFFLFGTAGLFYNFSQLNTAGDEAPLLSATLKMMADKSLRPDYPSLYHLPLAVYWYLPLVAFMLLALRWLGVFADFNSLREFGMINYADFLPWARFITVLAGALSLYVMHRLTLHLFKKQSTAWLATFLLAASLIFTQQTHFARVWAPQLATVLLALYFIARLYTASAPGLRHYGLAALGVGLAFGTHLIGSLVYVPFLVAHVLRQKPYSLARLARHKGFLLAHAILLAMYGLIYYLNPYGFTHYAGGLVPDAGKLFPLIKLGSAPAAASAGSGFWPALWYYLTTLWWHEPLLLLLFIAGSILMLYKRERIWWIFMSFVGSYLFFLSLTGGRQSRYLLLVIPFLVIIAARGMEYWRLAESRARLAAAVMFGAVLLVLPILWNYKFMQPSTIQQALRWWYANIPAQARVINLYSDLEINENRQSLEDIKQHTDYLTVKRAYLLSVSDDKYPRPNYYVWFAPHYRTIPDALRAKKWQYLIIGWWTGEEREAQLASARALIRSDQYLSLLRRFPEQAADDAVSFDLAGNMAKPLWQLWRLRQNGPVIDIYAIK